MSDSKALVVGALQNEASKFFDVSYAYASTIDETPKLSPSIIDRNLPVVDTSTSNLLKVLGNECSEGLGLLILDLNMPTLDKQIVNILNDRGYVSPSVLSVSDIFADTMSSTMKPDLSIEWNREIKNIVESGNVERARCLLNKMDASRINYYGLQNWKTLLELPKVTVGEKGTGKSFSNSEKILQSKKSECAGKWLAILDDKYLGCHKSKVSLYKDLKKQNKLKGAMFFFIEK